MNRYKGTYFTSNTAKTVQPWSTSEGILVNDQDTTQLKKAVLKLIEGSRKYLKICSFILNDMEIFEALRQKLVQEDVVLFVLTSLDPQKLSSNYLTEEEMSEESTNRHLSFISTLYNLGGHIRAADNIHAKFIIADSSSGVIMSANLTKYSLNQNPESGISISNAEDIKSVEVLFEKIYLKATDYKTFHKRDKGRSMVSSVHRTISANDFDGLEKLNLTFTYETLNNSLYQNLISIIDNAKRYVRIGTYSIVQLSYLPELIETLQKAKKRGVDIKFFCRAMNHRNDHRESCEKLLEMGIPIYGDLYNHAKGIATEKEGMIFTANIDGKHGLKSGFEVGLLLQRTQLEALRAFLEWQIETAPFVATQNPGQQELHNSEIDRLSLKNSSAPKQPSSITLQTNSIKIQDDLRQHPIYLLYKDDSVCGVKIKEKTYSCVLNGSLLSLKKEKRFSNYPQFMLTYHNLNIT